MGAPFESMEPQLELGLRTTPEKEGLGSNDSNQTNNGEENELLKNGEKKSDIPLADLFKSMKTAFAVKCPSHSGEVKKSPPGSKKSVDFLATSLMERAVAKSLDSCFSSPACNPTLPSSVLSMSPSSSMASVTPTPADLSLLSTLSTSDSRPELNTKAEILKNTANLEATSEPIHSEPTQANSQNRETALYSGSNFSGQVGTSSEPIQTSPLPPQNCTTANHRESSGLAMIGACYCSSSDDEL